jgi:Holliday junction DNA helicase RuvA
MIAYLSGTVLQKTTQYLLVEREGLGYKVFTTPETLNTPIGSPVSLYTYLKVADDGQTLFGMPDFASLQFFELLLTVTGVGPRMALTIISASRLDVLQNAIVSGDSAIFTRMSGVGKKTAERIILELKTKLAGGLLLDNGNTGNSEVFDALTGLGYNPREVREIITQLDGSTDTASQLKQALQLLAQK